MVAPVVGDAGFDALFARSLKKAKATLPALRDLNTTGPAPALLRQFFVHLETQEVQAIEDTVIGATVGFIKLLSTFIGEGLTWKLLLNAWPDVLPSEPPREDTP